MELALFSVSAGFNTKCSRITECSCQADRHHDDNSDTQNRNRQNSIQSRQPPNHTATRSLLYIEPAVSVTVKKLPFLPSAHTSGDQFQKPEWQQLYLGMCTVCPFPKLQQELKLWIGQHWIAHSKFGLCSTVDHTVFKRYVNDNLKGEAVVTCNSAKYRLPVLVRSCLPQ